MVRCKFLRLRPGLYHSIMPFALCALLLASAIQKPPVVLAVDTLVVGYRSGGKWVPTTNAYGADLPPMRFYGFGIGTVTGALDKVRLESGGDVGGAMLSDERAVGKVYISGAPPKVPRKVREMKTRDRRYLNLLSGFLASKGLGALKPRITRLVEVDLDGDRTREVLLEARNRENVESLSEGFTKADYSAVLLIHGRKTEALEMSSFAKDESMEAKRIRAVADLDGDGRMEIVTDGQGYEWTNVKLWGYRAGKLSKLLENGAGA